MNLEQIGHDWIHLAQEIDQWWALVTTVINLWVPKRVENVLTAERLLVSKKDYGIICIFFHLPSGISKFSLSCSNIPQPCFLLGTKFSVSISFHIKEDLRVNTFFKHFVST
jgi:hypothetical protein